MSLSDKITLSSFIKSNSSSLFLVIFSFSVFSISIFLLFGNESNTEFIIFSFVNGELFLYVCLIDVSISKVLSNAFFPIVSLPLGCLSVEYFVASFVSLVAVCLK